MVGRIEKIEAGRVVKRAEPDASGLYHCYPEGQTMARYASYYRTLDEVAEFLIRERRGRVRMNPDWSLIVDDIHIDGVAREHL